MQSLPGTYTLIFSSSRKEQISIGKLGTLQLKPGFYVYIGSAFGPGGLKARIAHHCRRAVRPHWHIDYLSPFLELNSIWYTYDPAGREHHWANILFKMRLASVPLTGFGSSDCRCRSHLLFFNSKPAIKTFRRKIYESIENHGKVFIERMVPPKIIPTRCLNE